jgi:hypothetical protein
LQKVETQPFTAMIKSTGETINRAMLDSKEGRQILDTARQFEYRSDPDGIPDEVQGTWLDHLITVTSFARAFGVNVSLIGLPRI